MNPSYTEAIRVFDDKFLRGELGVAGFLAEFVTSEIMDAQEMLAPLEGDGVTLTLPVTVDQLQSIQDLQAMAGDFFILESLKAMLAVTETVKQAGAKSVTWNKYGAECEIDGEVFKTAGHIPIDWVYDEEDLAKVNFGV